MKEQILKALRECSDYLSGEILSEQLGISRVSIWKHIRNLKKDGYVIRASPRGYRLVSSPDLLLPYEFPDLEQRIHYFPEIGSTMDAARELARRGAGEGTIVIAEAQAHGRGRLSREWLSPKGGIYFTLILRPSISPAYAPRINLMASVAVAATIRKLFGLKAELKWPNDVLIEGRKVCGILAEMDAEMDVVNFVNVGIGINANTSVPQFEKTATSLKDTLGREISRKEFLSVLLGEIERRQALLMEADLLEEWKKLSGTLNKYVRILSLGEVIVGRAIDIDTTGALIIRKRNGSLKKALAGDCIHLKEEAPDTDMGAVSRQHSI
ncbi:MAG TPA: biotin--[acetyl-CoA-carboxylase] ligase [Dehalococcoidia bacterium]|nr:biotin--[acetyl-CoA-carboxylase] ligase [Dehalococcoidia bacterium]